jgi:four helix bundle protein
MKAGSQSSRSGVPKKHSTLNVEHLTPNPQSDDRRVFDLEERLLEFAARVIRLVEALQNRKAAFHVGGQLLRSGTSPLGQHGEVQAAESLDDFIHKMKVCHKELNESLRWLKLIHHVPLLDKPKKAEPLLQEAGELCRIFNKSIQTARSRKTEEESSRIREDSPMSGDEWDPWLLGPWLLARERSELSVKSSTLRVQPPAGPVKYKKERRK